MSGDHDDFAVEPIPGLPERLPEGEHILWQGGPDWRRLAGDVFHVRIVAGYFALLIVWRAAAHWSAGPNLTAAAVTAFALLPLCAAGLALLIALARLSARTSLYTITNRRIVLRVGMALPTAINLPFAVIEGASLNAHADGSGDIVLALGADTDRMAWSNLWPHVRPWRLKRPEPMLRAIPDVRAVAVLLSQALAAAHPSGRIHAIELQDSQVPTSTSIPVGQAA